MKNIRKVSAFHQNWWYKPLSIVNPHKPSKIGGFSPYGMWFSISYQMVRCHFRLVGWFIPMDPHGSPPIYGKFKGMVYGLPTEAEREAYIALLLLYYWCYYWFTVNSCDKPIAMLEYVYVYINWHSKLIYIYYWFTNKDLQYDSSNAVPAVPWPPWPPGDSRGRDFAGLLPGDVCCHGHGKSSY